MRLAFLALAAAALAAQTADAALTCPFDLQSKVASTLANPPVASSGSSSGSSDGSSSGGKKHQSNGSSSGGGGGADVGNSDEGDSSEAGNAGSPSATTPAPSTTTTPAPSSTTTTAPTTTAPTTTTPAPSKTTAAPTTTTPSNSLNGTITIARGLQTVTVALDTGATTAPPSSGSDATTPVSTTPSTTTVAPGVVANNGATNSTSNSTSTTNSTTTVTDSFTCDETFYKQWDTLGIKCGGASIDVAAAVAAASCVIYSGTLGAIAGTTCVSMCAFPACTNGVWEYGASNGIASSVYSTVGISSFLSTDLAAGVSSRLTGSAVLVGNTTITSTKQCAYSDDSSFSSCQCSALSKNVTKSDSQIKKEREDDLIKGIISTDDTSNVGSVLAPTTQSVAGVTVFVSAVAAVASTAVGSVSAASASVATVGANVGVFTIEICQFGVMINQMQLEGKSAALALFGKQMAPSAFTFLPFGKLNDTSNNSTTRRLAEDTTSSNRGVAQYSRTLGIREDMLFLVTLAGVVVVFAGVLMLFGVAYGLSGLFMSREDFMNKFFDKMIGVLVLILILSQYTIGVTATYQIYYSSQLDDITDPKCLLAIASLVVLALGIVFYGFVIVKRYEDDIRDVGTATHINKKVCQRYGPFYDEYKFKNRFFFAAKMALALVSGIATGYVGMQAKYQAGILLAAHVFFFFYLEVQSPHHSRFVQTTTSFVTIMKIAVLALTFFLISATASSNLPSELQNGISLAIVGLNLFVLFLLMVRSLYAFWKKYQLQRDAKYDENEEQSAAQEYFKEEITPAQPKVIGQNDKQNPYVNGGANTKYDYNDGDDIRLRSATHMEESNKPNNYEDQPAIRYDQISRNGAQHYIVNAPTQYANNIEQRYSNNPRPQQYDAQSHYAPQYESQSQYPPQQQQYAPDLRQQQPQYAANPRAPYAASNEQFVIANSREQALYNQRRNDVVEL